jgi:nucleoside-diphosphate-sugar epimerase
MKKILITGQNSYVGNSLEEWLGKYPDRYLIEYISLRDDSWKEQDFSKYDVVFHAAAVVHKKEKPEMESLYFKINRDLTVMLAKKARLAGVKQFVFMSTMAVYGEEGKIGQDVVINRKTSPNPKTYYGRSKIEAENQLIKLVDETFKVIILRPPMIYGPNCPGNYTKLENLAKKIPVFPLIENKRSMLHVDKLSEFIKLLIDDEEKGLFLPQDDEYVNTSILVKSLAEQSGNKILLSRLMGTIIMIVGKRISVFNKIFGNLVYEK